MDILTPLQWVTIYLMSCNHATSTDVVQTVCLSLYLRFNGHFPGEPGLAGVYWSKVWWRWWWQLDYWNYKSCKPPVKSSPPTNQHPVFKGRMPFLSPNQQCQSTEGKISHSMDLLTPSSPGVFQLCLWPLIAPGYLGGGLPCLSSAVCCQTVCLYALYVW